MSITHSGYPEFPYYTWGETLADGIVQGLGLALAAVALPWMLWTGFGQADTAVRLSLVLYTMGAGLMLGCSATYHWLRTSRRKDLFRRFDRAAIFVMIAGTYSPFALTRLEASWGWGLMMFEWSLAVVGGTLAIVFPRRAERLLILLYLLMGWAIVVVLGPLTGAVGPTVVGLVLVGGLIYTAGVGIHAASGVSYHNALWHCCVLGAAGCHYAAILIAVAYPEAPLR